MPKTLGLCGYPFMSLTRCNTCKQFDACYAKMEAEMKEPAFKPVINDELLAKEAWKNVNTTSNKGKNTLYKLQSAKKVQ